MKIKTLQRKRFQSLGNYFADKLKYSTMKELPSHIKIPLIENSEAKFRDFLKADHVSAIHKLLFEKEIDFFQQEEAAKRGELFVQSEFSPVKVHTPYGGSPLRLKVSEPNGQVNFLKA